MNKLTAILFACLLGAASCGSSDDTSSDDTTAATAASADQSDDASKTTEAETETTAATAAEDEPADESSGDVSDDEAALIAALDAIGIEENSDTFSEEEIHCANTNLVTSIGIDTMASYGITVDNPDDSLIPAEYEVQVKSVKALTDCVDLVAAFSKIAGDCDLGGLGNDVVEAALRYDFLSEFAEYEENGDAAASASFDAAIEACSEAG